MEFATVRSSSMPPTPDEYVRENIEPTLTKGLAELCRARPSNPCTWLAEWLQANKPPPPKRAAPEPKPEPLSAEALAAATARYSTTADLRKLLTHDEERGGIPIRLLSARWLLTHFQKEGNEAARLEHRQWLEREHPEAFVSGETLERVLAELEVRTLKFMCDGKWTWPDGREAKKHGSFYMSKAESGEWRAVNERNCAYMRAGCACGNGQVRIGLYGSHHWRSPWMEVRPNSTGVKATDNSGRSGLFSPRRSGWTGRTARPPRTMRPRSRRMCRHPRTIREARPRHLTSTPPSPHRPGRGARSICTNRSRPARKR